jgi:hypothetical protein
VRSDTYIPAAILLSLFILLYLAHIGKFAPRAKSVLSPELESKRVAIMERHNLLVGVIGFVPLTTFVMLLLLAETLGHRLPPPVRIGALLAVVSGELFGLFRLLRYDEVMCERLGFMCPHCRQPLYEPRNLISVNGLCPKCHRSIIS